MLRRMAPGPSRAISPRRSAPRERLPRGNFRNNALFPENPRGAPLYETAFRAYIDNASRLKRGLVFLTHVSKGLRHGGALVSTGMLEAMVAGRGAAGLVKSGNKVIANNDYEYAYAA